MANTIITTDSDQAKNIWMHNRKKKKKGLVSQIRRIKPDMSGGGNYSRYRRLKYEIDAAYKKVGL